MEIHDSQSKSCLEHGTQQRGYQYRLSSSFIRVGSIEGAGDKAWNNSTRYVVRK